MNLLERFRQVYERKKVLFRLTLGALTGLIILSSITPYFYKKYFAPTEGPGNTESATDSEKAFEFFTVGMSDYTEGIDILGQIVFLEKVNISSKVTGRLTRLYIKEGQKVHRGQLIAEIDRLPLELTLKQQYAEKEIAKRSFDLAKAKYENALKSIEIQLKSIEKAKADVFDKKVTYQNMDRTLKNKKVLFDMGGISESDMEGLKAKHTTLYTQYLLAQRDLEIQRVGYRDQDIIKEGYRVPKIAVKRLELLKKINTKIERAELEAARSKIIQIEKSIESTRLLINETYIRSPLSGVIGAKGMEAGEMIKDDSIIGTILNISQVFMAFNVNEKDIPKVKLGQRVSFTVDAMGTKEFKGIIRRITPILDPKTRTIEVKALVDNRAGKLLPGMFARARISTGDSKKKRLIPASSLITSDSRTKKVFLVKKGLLFEQPIETGVSFKDRIEVLKGLKEGDVILSKGVNLAFAGMKTDTITPGKKEQ